MLTDDGRTTDDGDYNPISPPGAFGSGELRAGNFCIIRNFHFLTNVVLESHFIICKQSLLKNLEWGLR